MTLFELGHTISTGLGTAVNAVGNFDLTILMVPLGCLILVAGPIVMIHSIVDAIRHRRWW